MIKLISINIEGDKNLDKILPFWKKEDADIVCIQEAVKKDISLLAGTGYPFWRYSPMLKMNRPPDFPQKGLLMLTKNKPEHEEVAYYVGDPNEIPLYTGDPTAENRSIIFSSVKKDDTLYTIGLTHFTWSVNGDTTDKQLAHFAVLKKLLQDKKDLILCGDFNAPRGREIFTQLSTLYKDNIPQDIVSTLDPILHRIKGLDLVVDGLFTSPEYQVEDIRIVGGVSDHKAIVANISKV